MSRFSTAPTIKTEIRAAVTAGVRACARHRGGLRLSRRQRDPARHDPLARRRRGARVPAANSWRWSARSTRGRWSATPISRRPNTSTIDFTDFVCFNVYLHDEAAFRRYIARLHNLAVDKPLVLTEFGVDSMHNGADEQAQDPVVAGARRVRVGGGRHVRLRLDRRVVHRRASDRGLGLRAGRSRPRSRNRPFTRWRGSTTVRCRRRCRAIRGSRSWSAPTTPSARWRRASPRSRCSNYPDYEVIVVNDGSQGPHARNRRAVSVLPDHQPGEQGAERRAQCRRRGRDRRDRRLYRQRLRRRSGLADLSRRQDGGRQSRGLRRAEFPAARGQSGAGRGRGLAGRADACADQRRGRRAHRRLQHGVPPRRAARTGRVRSGLPRRRRRRRHLLALSGRRLHDRVQRRPRSSGISAATR